MNVCPLTKWQKNIGIKCYCCGGKNVSVIHLQSGAVICDDCLQTMTKVTVNYAERFSSTVVLPPAEVIPFPVKKGE